MKRYYKMYVGTYAAKDKESILLFHLYPDTGEIIFIKGFKGGEKPSYLAFDRYNNRLFAVNEYEDFDEQRNGAVCSFLIKEPNGFLAFQNRLSSRGRLPVYVEFIDKAQGILVANYTSGNIAAFPVERDGMLGEVTDTFLHHGSGSDKDRQAAAHVHQAVQSPDGRFIFAVDLGLDQIRGYTFRNGRLVPNSNPVVYSTKSGWGPRQLAFHPAGRHAYLVHELKSMVSVLSYDSADGTFEELHSLSCIPKDFDKENKCSGIRILPDGRNLYVSNRGHNSITVFSIDAVSKKLKYIENKNALGEWPREFCLSPDGNVLVVANQKSNNIVSFKIDHKTGTLHVTGYMEEVEKPVFVEILKDPHEQNEV